MKLPHKTRPFENILIWILSFHIVLAFPAAPVMALDEVQIERSFLEFKREWFDKLDKNGLCGESRVQVEQEPTCAGSYVARYCALVDTKEYRIKKTGYKASPYIGIMHYERWSCSSRGETPEEAERGPFHCEEQTEVTEIFRFTDGKWVY